MSSALHAEHARIAAAFEKEAERLGVLAGVRFRALCVELWALGEDYERDREQATDMIEELLARIEVLEEQVGEKAA